MVWVPRYISGIDDRRMGALLGCFIAADLESDSGQDRDFAEWAVRLLRIASTSPLSPGGDLVGDPLWEVPKRFSQEGEVHCGDAGRLLLSVLEARDDPELELGPKFAMPPLVARNSPELPPAMPHYVELARFSARQIVSLLGQAGGSAIPAGWWSHGVLADPIARGHILEAVSLRESGQQASLIALRHRLARSVTGPVRHPRDGIWFGNPLDAATVPDSVGTVVALGPLPRVVVQRDVQILIVLPWFADDCDSPVAGDPVDPWFERYDIQHRFSGDTCPAPDAATIRHAAASQRPTSHLSAALATATAQIDSLVGLCGDVLVIGDWSGTHLPQLWDRLDRTVGGTSRGDEHIAQLYSWKPRLIGWLGPAPTRSRRARRHRVGSEAGARFYGVAVGDEVGHDDRVDALARRDPPATMSDAIGIQARFRAAKLRGDHRAMDDARAALARVSAAVRDVEQLSASEFLDALDEASVPRA